MTRVAMVGPLLLLLLANPSGYGDQKLTSANAKSPPLLPENVGKVITAGIHRPNSQPVIRIPIPANSQSRPLFLRESSVSCGCGAVALDPNQIPVGGHGDVVFRFKLGNEEGDHSYSVRTLIQTDSIIGVMPTTFSDDFAFTLKARKECSFFQSNNLLASSADPKAVPYIVRAVNYSDKTWIDPTARFSTIDAPCIVTSTIEQIDGVQTQVLQITADRLEFSRQMLSHPAPPESTTLLVSAATMERLQPRVIGQFEVRLWIQKPVEIRPTIINWDVAHPRVVVLIVVVRSSTKTLTSDDFKVTIGNTPMVITYEELRPGWGRLVIPSDQIQSSSKDVREFVVSIPDRNFRQPIALRFVE